MARSKPESTDESELRPYASSPCLLHELDPQFQGSVTAGNWESVRRWRRAQRTRLIEERQSLDSAEQQRISAVIAETLASKAEILQGCIGFYWPLDGEIDLRPLMRQLSDQGLDLALPVIRAKDQPMEFSAWDTNTRMTKQQVWNIPVPAEHRLLVPSVVIVPMLGFDEQGHRLGHGGGYYDRTLAALKPKPLAVGVGYQFGKLETIYPQSHDVPMDEIITAS